MINGRRRVCGPYNIGPAGATEMELVLPGADGTARFYDASGALMMTTGAHVNVIDRNTTLFSLNGNTTSSTSASPDRQARLRAGGTRQRGLLPMRSRRPAFASASRARSWWASSQ